MKYQVTVGDKVVEVDLSGAIPMVDGEEFRAQLQNLPGTGLHHLLLDGKSHSLLAARGERSGSWRLTLAGRPVEVEAIDERTRAILAMSGGTEVSQEKSIIAPMPGMVMRVEVEVGDTISAGQGVIVVEAMKMENELKAPADGVVARIEVGPGQAVEKGAVLIVLE